VDGMTGVRGQIQRFLQFTPVDSVVSFEVVESMACQGYTRQRINFPAGDGDQIPAYLLIPGGEGPSPAVIIHHQHASQRHLGKSEVVGLAGDPLQAFGQALAQRGFVVLAPDSICFEDRRRHATGSTPHEKDDLGHYEELGRRLVQGDTLMRKVLADASCGVSLLACHPAVDPTRIGSLGHSYGGNTVLFQAALEQRISFAVSSGALCSYAYKRQHHIPLEMALIIPGFARQWDLHHLLSCIAPRRLLVVSAEDDPNSKDAPEVIARAEINDHVSHYREAGGHAMTPARFEHIISYVEQVGQG
jgi:dienelactone hydrolase